ncbi:MAG: chromosome segregation protein SMC [Archaeoglobaceae archaeon]|nr:chromosome segregation protein SMC [Archaeoglobaceae archaeon]MDW8128270.1 chromosome segregation protein SMC [Archaeoglobaceae archaeon]
MQVTKITLRNFKSFSKKVEIPLYPGFTVITGPNGSGKSNIIDSILFCLGLSTSTKQLRAERLSDLVSEGKKETEVSITLGDDGRKYEITRRVKITDKGHYSYYYLDNKSVSWTDVQNLLSQLGIYSDAYNIVMQGDVTRIVEMSPVQRRRVIEDIAGISEFDEKKERALEELDIVRENIEKIEAVIAEVESMLSILERDRNEALRYKELMLRKAGIEKQIKAHELRSLQNSRERVEREIERVEKEKDRLASLIPEISQKIVETNEKLKEIADLISKFGDEKLSQIQTEILKLTSEVDSIKRSEKIYQEEIARIEEEELRKRSEVLRLKDELENIKNGLEDEILKKISVEEVVLELENKVKSLKQKLESADKRHQELKNKLIEKREEFEKLKEERNKLITERDKLLEIVRRIEIEIEDAKAERDRISTKLEEDKKNLEESSVELLKKEREHKNLNSQLIELDKKLFSLRSKLSDVEEESKRCEVELAKIKAKISTIQSYSKPVEAILNAKERRELAGIFGTVAQLGEVDEKFSTAIESAIGGALQFIVVETEDDAVEAIRYLKMLQAGRASFIPLRKIKEFTADLDRRILSERGVIDFAVNLIKCDRKFLPVFKFLLRDTVVVDTIENARRLMDRNLRIVTLDGDLVEKSGLISGGSRERKGLLISKELLEKERELSDRIHELQREKDRMLAELSKIEEERKSLKVKLDETGLALQEISGEVKVLEDRIRGYDSQLGETIKKIEHKTGEKVRGIEELKRANNSLSELEKKVKELEFYIEEIEVKLKESEIPEILNELDRAKEELTRNKEILISIERRIENLEFQKTQLEKNIETLSGELAQLAVRKDEFKSRIEDGRIKSEEALSRLKNLKEEERKLGERVKDLREERDELISRLRSFEEERSRADLELKRCEDRISTLNERLNLILEELKKFEGFETPETLQDPTILNKELSEVQEELSKFGEVNLKAIQDYENVKARRDELVEKKGILEKERVEIIERIEKYEKRKKETFFEVFNAINKNFGEILAELADGEGELFLDSDDVFNSGLHMRVRLKNKPMQKLEALSGGEKSLVALSLILAIQMFKPAPFYAFDEVDMFLDGVNVERVAKMIKKRSQSAQFIVVSLRKPMVESADAVVGITLGGDNSSIVTGIKLNSEIQSRS